jgi:hypothetical protein
VGASPTFTGENMAKKSQPEIEEQDCEEFEECDCLTKTDVKNFFGGLAIFVAILVTVPILMIGMKTTLDYFFITPEPTASYENCRAYFPQSSLERNHWYPVYMEGEEKSGVEKTSEVISKHEMKISN